MEISESAFGASGSGSEGMSGLKNVKNFAPAPIQTMSDTCGLYSAASVLDEFAAGQQMTNLESLYGRTVYKDLAANGGKGLDTMQLSGFLENNLGDQAAVVLQRNVTGSNLQNLLSRGSLIAHVDGNHFVRVLGTTSESGGSWVQVYDPARGIYEQATSSFMTRTGASNQMVHIISRGK